MARRFIIFTSFSLVSSRIKRHILFSLQHYRISIGFIALAISIFFAMKVDVDDSRDKVGASEIWHRFPKFIIGFFVASVIFSFIIMPTFGQETYSAILKTFSNYKGWCFCLAFTSIGLESNFKEMAYYMQGGKPLTLYVVGQTFNIVSSIR